MYKRVLVPLDGSRVAERVLPFIKKLAGPLDMEITLIEVVSLTPEEVLGIAPRFVLETAESKRPEVQQYLETWAKELEACGIRTSTHVAIGEAAAEIVAAAQRTGADLIAMTTHGRGGLARLLFGSVAEAVLRAAPVPVFLLKMGATTSAAAPEPPPELGRILFATDFSDVAEGAWLTARSLAAVFEAELIVEHAIPPLPMHGDAPPEIISRYWAEARVEAERGLARLGVEAGRLKLRTRLEEGRIADRILRAAAEERADLIVMGTAGRTGVRRVLLGSVAAEVVRLAQCPVVIVGPARQKEEESEPEAEHRT